jgi:dTDP-4-amino-4,6-dideoxygalactose transaminase
VKIPIARPLFGPEEFEAIQKPLESGYVLQGPFVEEFEHRLAAYVGVPHAVASTSCTSALHLIGVVLGGWPGEQGVVPALGVEPGDEVILPAFTWVSTANVVELMGATPVFCDVDLATYNVDVEQLESLVTERTVGIIAVHLFGLSADLDPILELTRRRRLWLVEDAACALGCAQMDRLDDILTRRRELAGRYDELLADLDAFATPHVPDGYVHGYQAYVCLFRPDEPVPENVDRLHRARNDLMRELERAGIQTRQGTHAPILTAFYARKYGLRPEQFPNAYAADRLSLALPLYAQMTEDEQATVFTELSRAFATV